MLRDDIPGVVGLVSGHLLPPSYTLNQDRGDDMTYRDTTTPAISFIFHKYNTVNKG